MFWNLQFETLRYEFRPTLRLALPLVLAELSWMIVATVDPVMVGRLRNAAVVIGAAAIVLLGAVAGGTFSNVGTRQ